METKPYTKNGDGVVFGCCNRSCNDFSGYVSIYNESQLLGFTISLRSILLIACKWFNNHTHVQIDTEINIRKKSIIKTVDLLRNQYLKYEIKKVIYLGEMV
ncbi:hypothetical protein A0H76_1886 [Hepatospora eriocheir]|uniref:Uncharacterized protein n=1 Tax=Hepatospora eriocheir TaxID=1081669 RepID=A0A1X0QGL5_9MICR|nr:hypothetical protein A0H76_1886 [Hepatospora eriocheir]